MATRFKLPRMKQMVSLGRVLLLCSGGLAAMATAHAQSLCTSDGAPPPTALHERFINADCADCWRAPTDAVLAGSSGTLSLDWIAPGNESDDGPLSAAARIDSLSRLKALGQLPPPRMDSRTQPVNNAHVGPQSSLRVSHGLPVGDYLGTSIEWRNAPVGHWRAWLLMVEALPAGTAGSPIARHLVRNSLPLDWTVSAQSGSGASSVPSELRPMQIPQGAQADRLAVVGWVESFETNPATQQPALAALALSRCDPAP